MSLYIYLYLPSIYLSIAPFLSIYLFLPFYLSIYLSINPKTIVKLTEISLSISLCTIVKMYLIYRIQYNIVQMDLIRPVFVPLTVMVDSYFWDRWLWPEAGISSNYI